MGEASVFKYQDKDDNELYKMVKKGQVRQILQDIILKRFRIYIVFVLERFGLRK